MKWIKKWSYLIVFLVSGLVYLSLVDHWQVYAESFLQLKEWYREWTGASEEQKEIPDKDSSDAGEDDGPGEGAAAGGEEAGPGNSTAESGGAGGEEDGPGNSTAESGGAGGEGIGPGNAAETESTAAQEDLDGEEGAASGEISYMTVEDDYFADAVFIGDSRTVGMYEYGGLEEVTTFYASKGMTVYKLFDSEIVPAQGGKITVEEALGQNSFGKIYLMVGINEMGTGTVETFLEKYGEAVEHLQELQPDAVIYVQAIIKVTAERSAKGDYINNEGIEARNEGISLLADNKKVFFLDVNPLVCDESGGLNPDYTFDGVHLLGKYIEIWKDYLKAHAISP